MKKGVIIISAIVLVLAVAGVAWMNLRSDKMTKGSSTSKKVQMSKDAFLKSEGKALKNAKGEAVQLKGFNIGNYFVQEFWMSTPNYTDHVTCQKELEEKLTERFGKEKTEELIDTFQDHFFTEKDFDNIKAMGMNSIRIPFWYGTFTDAEGNWKEDAFKRLDWFVEEAGKREMYVILDMHGAYGSQNGSDHSGIDGREEKMKASEFFFGDNAEKNQELYYQLWEKIAEHYKGNPVVAGYDLLNEPYCTYRYNTGMTDDEIHKLLWDVYDQAYDKIRKIDPDHVIIMEATWDSWDLPNPKDYNWTNVMYEYHQYEYSNYENENNTQITSMERKIHNVELSDYDVPNYMGEFNYFNNMDAWTEGLKLLNEHHFNWSIWSYKCLLENENWGIKRLSQGKLDLENDSYEDIMENWSSLEEANDNKDLIEAIKKVDSK